MKSILYVIVLVSVKIVVASVILYIGDTMGELRASCSIRNKKSKKRGNRKKNRQNQKKPNQRPDLPPRNEYQEPIMLSRSGNRSPPVPSQARNPNSAILPQTQNQSKHACCMNWRATCPQQSSKPPQSPTPRPAIPERWLFRPRVYNDKDAIYIQRWLDARAHHDSRWSNLAHDHNKMDRNEVTQILNEDERRACHNATSILVAFHNEDAGFEKIQSLNTWADGVLEYMVQHGSACGATEINIDLGSAKPSESLIDYLACDDEGRYLIPAGDVWRPMTRKPIREPRLPPSAWKPNLVVEVASSDDVWDSSINQLNALCATTCVGTSQGKSERAPRVAGSLQRHGAVRRPSRDRKERASIEQMPSNEGLWFNQFTILKRKNDDGGSVQW